MLSSPCANIRETQTSDDDTWHDEPRVDEQVQGHENARDVQRHLRGRRKRLRAQRRNQGVTKDHRQDRAKI